MQFDLLMKASEIIRKLGSMMNAGGTYDEKSASLTFYSRGILCFMRDTLAKIDLSVDCERDEIEDALKANYPMLVNLDTREKHIKWVDTRLTEIKKHITAAIQIHRSSTNKLACSRDNRPHKCDNTGKDNRLFEKMLKEWNEKFGHADDEPVNKKELTKEDIDKAMKDARQMLNENVRELDGNKVTFGQGPEFKTLQELKHKRAEFKKALTHTDNLYRLRLALKSLEGYERKAKEIIDLRKQYEEQKESRGRMRSKKSIEAAEKTIEAIRKKINKTRDLMNQQRVTIESNLDAFIKLQQVTIHGKYATFIARELDKFRSIKPVKEYRDA